MKTEKLKKEMKLEQCMKCENYIGHNLRKMNVACSHQKNNTRKKQMSLFEVLKIRLVNESYYVVDGCKNINRRGRGGRGGLGL